jgi:hypothetical protein
VKRVGQDGVLLPPSLMTRHRRGRLAFDSTCWSAMSGVSPTNTAPADVPRANSAPYDTVSGRNSDTREAARSALILLAPMRPPLPAAVPLADHLDGQEELSRE